VAVILFKATEEDSRTAGRKQFPYGDHLVILRSQPFANLITELTHNFSAAVCSNSACSGIRGCFQQQAMIHIF
jgi:hypothetical protein